jgi:flagellar biosynthesis protein FlhF
LQHKRIFPTSAEALKKITEEFGEEVSIVATKQVEAGVEVHFTLEGDPQPRHQSEDLKPLRPQGVVVDNSPKAHLMSSSDSVAMSSPMAEDLVREVAQLKSLVQQQFSQMSWQNWASGDPLRGKIWQDLQDLGFSPLLSRTLVDAIPKGLDHSQASAWVIEAIVHQLGQSQPQIEMVQKGGVYAVVGPTGSGKTTTIAKIAARSMALKGKASVALITTDTYRICAIDQLRTYGKVIGVPVHVALNASELQGHLNALSKKHLVLIDTMGLSPRDSQTSEQNLLLERHDIQKVLVMNVSSQSRALMEMAERFKGTSGFYGAVLTKLDECSYIAGSIDLALREKLNIMYMSTGQRVPDDLFLADPHFLVQRAMRKQYEEAFARTEEEVRWLRYGVANSADSSSNGHGI